MRRQVEKGEEPGGQGGRAEIPICERGQLVDGVRKEGRTDVLRSHCNQVSNMQASRTAGAALDYCAQELASLGETDGVKVARGVESR